MDSMQLQNVSGLKFLGGALNELGTDEAEWLR